MTLPATVGDRHRARGRDSSTDRYRIYAFAEYYPDPFKPYIDTQFADWVAQGHDLQIFAFGSWGDVGNSSVSEYGLAGRTSYLPGGGGAVLAMLPRLLAASVSRFGRSLRVLRRETGTPRRRVLYALQALLLPARAPDLCLIHNLTTATRLGLLRLLYPDARIAMYYHGGETAGPLAPSDAAGAFDRVDIVFTNTEYSRRSALARGCADAKIRVMPLGFNLREFAPREDRQYKPDGTLRLIAASRLSIEKGLTVLLEALAIVAREGQPVVCTIVGDGPERAALEARALELDLGDRTKFAGLLSRDQVLEAFGEADALVLTSIPTSTWEENQACVLQEAMLSRLIVITSRTGGVPESIAPAMQAFSSEPGDAVALASTIRRLTSMSRREFDTLGRSNHAYCEARYDVRVLNTRLLAEALGLTQG